MLVKEVRNTPSGLNKYIKDIEKTKAQYEEVLAKLDELKYTTMAWEIEENSKLIIEFKKVNNSFREWLAENELNL